MFRLSDWQLIGIEAYLTTSSLTIASSATVGMRLCGQ